MRKGWWLLALLLLACDLPYPGSDWDRALGGLNESALALFALGRSDRGVPSGPLKYQAGAIYSTEPAVGADSPEVWQVRHPRADAIQLPLTARDRLERVDLKADVLVSYEHRYCRLPAGPGTPARCQAWQPASCCNQIWKRSRGEWVIEPAG